MKIDWDILIEEWNDIAKKASEDEIQIMIKEGYKYEDTISTSNKSYPLYDVCGNAYIKFKDMRKSFVKEYVKYMISIGNSTYDNTFSLYNHSGRQELRVNKAIALAIAKHLNEKYNADVFVRWYVD